MKARADRMPLLTAIEVKVETAIGKKSIGGRHQMRGGVMEMIGQKRQIVLNPNVKSPVAQAFEDGLRKRIIGQDRAVRTVTSLYQVFQAGLTAQNRPLGTYLFLGPTGSGKTRVVEAAAELLFGDANSVIKIDCAEFQHSHEIAKLIGSPPGYLGHRETSPMLTQDNLEKCYTETNQFSLVLFDEIEKASDALWQLLLGILDKATLTLGDNRRVDFSRTMIFMTSNLGAKEMSELITGSIGFAPARTKGQMEDNVDQKIYRTALEAARKKFSPEFMNRIDKVVVFRSLKASELEQILELELAAVQHRIDQTKGARFTFRLTPEARNFMLTEGTNYQYGARHLKRAIERYMVFPFSSLLASEQVRTGDVVVVDLAPDGSKLCFAKDETAFESVSIVARGAALDHGSETRVAA